MSKMSNLHLELTENEELSNDFIRISRIPGGCLGMNYVVRVYGEDGTILAAKLCQDELEVYCEVAKELMRVSAKVSS